MRYLPKKKNGEEEEPVRAQAGQTKRWRRKLAIMSDILSAVIAHAHEKCHMWDDQGSAPLDV